MPTVGTAGWGNKRPTNDPLRMPAASGSGSPSARNPRITFVSKLFKEIPMQRLQSRVTGLLTRRTAIVAFALLTVGGTAAALLAAEPTMKPKSRTTAPTASPVAVPARPHGALASTPPSVAPDPAPSWFPAGSEKDKECEDLRKLLREHGDKTVVNGCIDEDEAYLLWHKIRRSPSIYKTTFDLWLKENGYLRSNPQRRKEILDSIFRTFGTSDFMDLDQFKRFLRSLGLMCSASPTSPGGGSGGGVVLPDLGPLL